MEKAKRQSNFELLRIFAMVLICLAHVQQHGSQPILTGDYGYFGQPIIYKRLLVFEIGSSLGAIGNGLFIMISGYFLNSNLNINTGKIAKKLLLLLGFAVTALIIANAVWIYFFKKEELTFGIVTKSDFNGNWWFVGYYFLVILAAKLFFNKFTAKLTQSQFKSLLLTVLAVSQFTRSGGLLDNLAGGLRTLSIGVFFFLLGGYIAKYNPFKNLKTYSIFLIIAGAVGIVCLSKYNSVSKSIGKFIESNSVGVFNYVHTFDGYSNYEIIIVIFVISVFELFRRLSVSYNGVINFIGKSTLMIYFIHENAFFQMFYKDADWMQTLKSSLLQYCLKWFKWAAIAFAVGLAAYCLYTLLGKLLPRMRSWFVEEESSE